MDAFDLIFDGAKLGAESAELAPRRNSREQAGNCQKTSRPTPAPDAFNVIFDEAAVDVQPDRSARRQKQGRAASTSQSKARPPAPTNSVPAKAGRPAMRALQAKKKAPVATQPAKAGRRKATILSKSEKWTPSAAIYPADEAGEMKAVFDSKTSAATPSSPPIPRKRGRPAKRRGVQPITGLPAAINSDIACRFGNETHLAIAGDQDGGHSASEPSGWHAAVQPIPDGYHPAGAHELSAIGSDRVGRKLAENRERSADAVAHIQAHWKMRQRWHKAEKALILAAKALCRGFTEGDKKEGAALFDEAWKSFLGKPAKVVPLYAVTALAPFLPAIQRFEEDRATVEKSIVKLSKTLPAYEWAKSQPGIDKSFAWIIGEAGDIGAYRSVAALWKRMGVAVINGERQRRKSDAAEALLHGYNPSRRSVMWNVGGALIGSMGRGPRPSPGEDISAREDWSHWQRMFISRCRYECERDPEKFPLKVVDKENGEQRESYTQHCQARAKRYVEKKFLRDLYARWRLETLGEVVDPDTEWMRRRGLNPANSGTGEAAVISAQTVEALPPLPTQKKRGRPRKNPLPIAAE